MVVNNVRVLYLKKSTFSWILVHRESYSDNSGTDLIGPGRCGMWIEGILHSKGVQGHTQHKHHERLHSLHSSGTRVSHCKMLFNGKLNTLKIFLSILAKCTERSPSGIFLKLPCFNNLNIINGVTGRYFRNS